MEILRVGSLVEFVDVTSKTEIGVVAREQGDIFVLHVQHKEPDRLDKRIVYQSQIVRVIRNILDSQHNLLSS